MASKQMGAESKRAKIVAKHPLAIRWFHWINFPVIAIMVWSGLLIYWPSRKSPYQISFYGHMLFKFFPDWFYAPVLHGVKPVVAGTGETPLYRLDARLAEGLSWHFMFFWFFTINGLLYVLYLIFAKQWKVIVPTRASFADALHVVLFDMHLRKDRPPRRYYNGAQQITYTGVIVMGLLMLLTGLTLYKPVQLGWLTALFGGYQFARLIHFTVTMLFIAFFLVHVLQVVRAGWNNFRGMITGRELVVEAEKPKEEETVAAAG